MELATCSYSEFKTEMGYPVRISIGSPRFKTNYELKDNHWSLTPRASYLRASDAVFYGSLEDQMSKRGAQKIWDDLLVISKRAGQERLVLLCFERLDRRDDCHRTFVAKWMGQQLGIEIPELGATPDKPAGDTPRLF